MVYFEGFTFWVRADMDVRFVGWIVGLWCKGVFIGFEVDLQAGLEVRFDLGVSGLALRGFGSSWAL